MKSLFRTGLLAALVAACSAGAQAQTLHVVTEKTPNSYLQDGRVAGPGTELVELTLKRAGITDYRVDLYPWARAQDIALREPHVLIFPLARTPERENLYRWIGEMQRIRYYLYALPDRSDLKLGQLDDARGLSIGVVRDDVRQLVLQRRGFTRLAVSAQPMENLRKLLYRQVDLIPLTEREAQNLCADARGECTGLARLLPLDEVRTSLYLAFSLATPEDLASRTSAAFETLRADGSLARIMGPSAVPAPPGASAKRAAN
jgi:polar amino acid transport system substrate-binding protein